MGACRIIARDDGETLRCHSAQRVARGVAASDRHAGEAVALDEPDDDLAQRFADAAGDLGVVERPCGRQPPGARRILVLGPERRVDTDASPCAKRPRRGFDGGQRWPRHVAPDRAFARPRAARSRRRSGEHVDLARRERRRRSGDHEQLFDRGQSLDRRGRPAGRFIRKRPKPCANPCDESTTTGSGPSASPRSPQRRAAIVVMSARRRRLGRAHAPARAQSFCAIAATPPA